MKKIFSLILIIFSVSFFLINVPKSAQALDNCSFVTSDTCTGDTKITTTDNTKCDGTIATGQVCCCTVTQDAATITGTKKTTALTNPLGGIESPQALIGQVINSLFGIVGSLALVMFIYGGFLWMTSAGSSEQVKKGKDIFIWAVVGLVVVFSAYSIVRFVIQGIGA